MRTRQRQADGCAGWAGQAQAATTAMAAQGARGTAGAAFLAAMCLLAGCSTMTTPPEARPRLPPLQPTTEPIVDLADAATAGLGGPVVKPPAWAERIQHLALQEWTLWGQARWQLPGEQLDKPRGAEAPSEAAPPFTSRVMQYWVSATGAELPRSQLQFPDGSLQPWSAAFITHLVRGTGLGPDKFPAGRTHWNYIRASLEKPRRSSFDALDASQVAPQLSDLICAPREASVAQFSQFSQLSRLSRQERERNWPFHCDLVVAVQRDAVGAVGGNVHERVVWTQAPLDAQGRLLPVPPRPWLLILRRSAAQLAATDE
ncbi:hypothetical protein DBR42_26160 [Pelomonas sp. HMWF004]|nr:hypothetical protein DBR42_26160 [Pelomonas sp. HMWF004]